ncbi:MAG: hypothetical protein C0410_15645 [Anaerolinea sp.]|nr:hypothetical protein [Anaerolinea sp.]
MRHLKLGKHLATFSVFLISLSFSLAVSFFLIKSFAPEQVRAANFTNAYATMGNSRFSYYAGVTSGTTGSSNITIDTSGNPDKDVDHLFPKDVVCFANATLDGCKNGTYQVASTEGVDGDQFTITTPLTSTLLGSDLAIATQSGTITLTVTLATTVPDGGDILLTIPMSDTATATTGNDGFPDYNTSVATSGFDLNGILAANLAISTSTSGTCNNSHWSIGSATIAHTSDHTIRIDRSGSSCEANSTILTITLGNSSKGIVNPAPINNTRNQGEADEYTINIKTRDNADATIDNSNLMIAPIEAVLVSATVQETLSFKVAAVSSSTAACGASATTDITTTAMAVPWGTISSSATFYDAAQQLTVSTNANNGYSVTIQEEDQMGKDGAACTGSTPSAGHYTFGSNTCIRDTVCGATPCSESAGYGWSDAGTYPGLGYSVNNIGGDTDAAFVYNSNDPCSTSAGAGTFCAKQIADTSTGVAETPGNVMYKTGPTDTADAYVCFRLSVPGTQPAGYYYNKVRYTAIPKF